MADCHAMAFQYQLIKTCKNNILLDAHTINTWPLSPPSQPLGQYERNGWHETQARATNSAEEL